MKKPEIPDNETDRLKALRSLSILDTPPEERFDRLTRMAKRLFNVPIVLVSLVDENRQWFKSCIGLSVRESPRDISFCGHTILGEEIFVISDASKDVRFADNPLVTNEPFIRFYAGCPLKYSDGNRIGTFCIVDTKPRTLDNDDIQTLMDLAGTAESELAAIQLATSDELTQVLNRRGFMMIGQHNLKVCLRQNLSASLVFMDLDNFKEINDAYGHIEGDRALRDFANLINSRCRESDLFARLGGDEFVLLFNKTSKNIANSIMQDFLNRVSEFNKNSARGYEIRFSYGIVEFKPERHDTIEKLLIEGDQLMYTNKKNK